MNFSYSPQNLHWSVSNNFILIRLSLGQQCPVRIPVSICSWFLLWYKYLLDLSVSKSRRWRYSCLGYYIKVFLFLQKLLFMLLDQWQAYEHSLWKVCGPRIKKSYSSSLSHWYLTASYVHLYANGIVVFILYKMRLYCLEKFNMWPILSMKALFCLFDYVLLKFPRPWDLPLIYFISRTFHRNVAKFSGENSDVKEGNEFQYSCRNTEFR